MHKKLKEYLSTLIGMLLVHGQVYDLTYLYSLSAGLSTDPLWLLTVASHSLLLCMCTVRTPACVCVSVCVCMCVSVLPALSVRLRSSRTDSLL